LLKNGRMVHTLRLPSTTLLSLLVAGSLSLALPGPAASSEVAFKIIVNPKVGGRAITRDTLAQIYLGRAQRWGDGRPIVPVDQSGASAVRAAFSVAVLGMPVPAVVQHWLRVVATGTRPPVTRQSDADVIAFVAAESGGVGYVSAAAPLPETVALLALQ
jgi:hypothetical protein